MWPRIRRWSYCSRGDFQRVDHRGADSAGTARRDLPGDWRGGIAKVFGLGADMGFGVLHLNSGLDYLFGIAHTQWIQVGLITLMMGAAIIVAVAGVDKGVRVMSDINMLLACALLLFVL